MQIGRVLKKFPFSAHLLPFVFWVYDEERFLKPLIQYQKGTVFLDIGSSIGRYTYAAAKKGMIVHAWEPNSVNREGLLINLSVNKISAIVHPEALGDSEGSMFISHREGWSRLDEEGEERVPIRTLDSYNLENVSLMKIDVEGFEEKVLRGATATLVRNRPEIIVELHPFVDPDVESKCSSILENLGYAVENVGETPPAKHIRAIPNGRS